MAGLKERSERFLLVKRGLYYRPDNAGYTGIKEYAGRYREVDALGLDGVAAIHEDDAPEYSSACFADLAQKHLQGRLDASLARIEALEAALREARDQLWLLAKDPSSNPWIAQCDEGLASHGGE